VNGILLRAAEHLHGHLAWLATLALAHPALLLRRPRPRLLGATLAATLLVTACGALGAVLYPPYRQELKPLLFAAAPHLGVAFERKEHLAVGAVALSWVGLTAYLAERKRTPESGPSVAFVAYAGAAALALLTACLGTAVAVGRTF
jgi:hypothetical protein